MADQLDLSGFDAAMTAPAQPSKELDLSSFDAAQQPISEPGQLESLGRGAVQGATLGFGDEITGAGKSAVQSLLESLNLTPDDKLSFEQKYDNERDITRANNKAAEDANPWTYGGGNIAGAVGTGLLAGGAGVVAKGAGALGLTGLESAAASGGLGALSTVGAGEGALMGLGSSNADNLKDQLIDTGTGAAIGGLAPVALKGAGKLIKGTAGAIDSGITAIPKAGEYYTNLKDIAKEGAANLQDSFKGTAQKALSKLSSSAEDLKSQGLAQEAKFGKDLTVAQAGSNKASFGATKEFKDQLAQKMGAVGQDLQRQDIVINDEIKKLPSHLRIVDGELELGKFNFDHLNDQFKAIGDKLEKTKGLQDIQNGIKSGDYLQVADKIRDLDALIESADPYEKRLLIGLKNEIQQTVDNNLQKLPGDAGKLYGKRKDIAKDYSLLADVRDELGASKGDFTPDLQRKTSFMANEASPEGLGYKEEFSKAYQVGDEALRNKADDALAKAAEFNKFNVENPSLGEMGLGQNEQNLKQFTDVFGKPKESGFSPSFAKSVEDLNDGANSITSSSKKGELIDWLRNTYGDKAEGIIKELQDQSKKFQLFKSGLKNAKDFGGTTHGLIRGLKSVAEPLAFSGGQAAKSTTNYLKDKAAEANLSRLISTGASTVKTLTQPQSYKNTVEEFKQSQRNGDSTE